MHLIRAITRVVIPELARRTVRRSIWPRRVAALAALALLIGVPTADATTYYVAPNGVSSNSGTIDQPLDLPTALSSQGPVRPGDTVWLRGGVYRRQSTTNGSGDPVIYQSTVSGSPTSPIVFRQYPGERATLDGNLASSVSVLVVYGSYTIFWGFEITNSATNRFGTGSRGNGLNSYGHHNKYINLVIHDTGQGIGFWSTSTSDDSEVSGCLIYNVGMEASDRGHGHSLYVQNITGSKRIVDNIMFNGFSFGIHAYAENGRVDNVRMEGNMLFNHGILSAVSGAKANLIISSNTPAQAPQVLSNYGYYPAGSAGRNVQVGNCNQATVQQNYLAGGTPLIVAGCTSTVVSNNTLYGPVASSLQTQYPNNIYGQTPSGLTVGVRRNLYEPGRAHVVVYNWNRQSHVPINLADAGLAVSDTFEIRDSQDYFAAPVVTGTYAGGTVLVPMTGLTAAPVVGNAPIQPGHTSVEFGVFVVRRTGGTGQPPGISHFVASPATVGVGTPVTLSWATSNATSVSIAPGIGAVAASGTRVVTPSTTTTYTLSATNGTQTTTGVATVTVIAVSPSGTIVPTNASQIVDAQGAVWTIGSGNAILRNGTLAAQGYGTRIAWLGGTIYMYGLNSSWLRWTGSGWDGSGPPPALPRSLLVNFGAPGGLWRYDVGPSWGQLHPNPLEAMAAGDFDNNGIDDIVMDFGGPGGGVWILRNQSSWFQLHTQSPTLMAVGDFDANGLDDLALHFAGGGLYIWFNSAAWAWLHSTPPSALLTANIDGTGGDDLIVMFPGHGVWAFRNNATWSHIHGFDATMMVAGDLDAATGADDLLLMFPGRGLYRYANHATWTLVHTFNVARAAVGDIDGNGRDDIVIDFGAGVGLWTLSNGTTWAPLHSMTSEGLVVSDLNSNGRADIAIDFGPSAGTWLRLDDGTWPQVHSLSASGLATADLN